MVAALDITPVDRRNPPKWDAHICHALLRLFGHISFPVWVHGLPVTKFHRYWLVGGGGSSCFWEAEFTACRFYLVGVLYP